jgi:hypothetical protein
MFRKIGLCSISVTAVNLPFDRFAKYSKPSKSYEPGSLVEATLGDRGSKLLSVEDKGRSRIAPWPRTPNTHLRHRARGLMGARPGSRLAAREKPTEQT